MCDRHDYCFIIITIFDVEMHSVLSSLMVNSPGSDLLSFYSCLFLNFTGPSFYGRHSDTSVSMSGGDNWCRIR